MWRQWTSLADFDSWHDAACAALGIPHPGFNAATGEVDEDAQWTTAYTEAVEVSPDDWRAVVEDDVTELVPEGLGVPCDPPPYVEPELNADSDTAHSDLDDVIEALGFDRSELEAELDADEA
jgi:hypothetical protein